jgi:hypothetical protein
MFNKSNSTIGPSSPARRHFMAIAAAGVRRLSAVSIAASALSAIDARTAAAHRHHGHWHDQWHGRTPGRDPGQGGGGIRCFGPGTLVQTVDGEMPIDALSVGMPVVTASGAMPIKWVGRKTIKRDGAQAWHPDVVPVRVSRFAIDDRMPRRDLYLSQEHALFIDGALIPVRHLVNGRSIAFDDSVFRSESIDYYHIELDSHQVIFAEGAPAETFRYTGGAVAWDNSDEYLKLYGDHRVMAPYAPVHSYGGVVSQLRGLSRLAVSRLVDVRDPIQIAHDRLAVRARAIAA